MPVSTTSRWPWSTRRRISASTAAARRLRDAPRTIGMTQKLQEKEQPSWIFTNARTRARRAAACTHPIAPTAPGTGARRHAPDRAAVAGDERRRLLRGLRDDDDVLRQAGERRALQVRAAARQVD